MPDMILPLIAAKKHGGMSLRLQWCQFCILADKVTTRWQRRHGPANNRFAQRPQGFIVHIHNFTLGATTPYAKPGMPSCE